MSQNDSDLGLQPTSSPDKSVVGEPPPLIDMAGNFYRDAIKWAQSGFQTSEAGEVEKRLAICADCEFFRGGRCVVCGCFMKYKASLATGSCPKGKW